jgi:hypothetical protein
LPSRFPGVWIATIVIVVIGAGIVFFAIRGADRARTDALEDVEVGDLAENVTAAVGLEPRSCPTGTLDHLRGSFTEDWSPAAVDVALERLVSLTRERWVYPLRANNETSCDGAEPQTEIGVGLDGSIVWSVAVAGRTTLRLPLGMTPAGVTGASAESP